jgi:hypothetical protein
MHCVKLLEAAMIKEKTYKSREISNFPTLSSFFPKSMGKLPRDIIPQFPSTLSPKLPQQPH